MTHPEIHPRAFLASSILQFCYTFVSPGRVGTSRVFGFLTSSARTRITSAITNRQSMAIVIATRIQDDFSSNRPHLLRVGTARRSLVTACGPTAHSSEPIFPPPLPHTQKKRNQSTAIISPSRRHPSQFNQCFEDNPGDFPRSSSRLLRRRIATRDYFNYYPGSY